MSFLSHIGLSGFPRTRGDVPERESLGENTSEFPPHTRGCTATRPVPISRPDVSPAHAGMYLYSGGKKRGHPRFPRTRGDVPLLWLSDHSAAPFPPHTRGCTSIGSCIPLGSWVSPRTRGDVPNFRVKESLIWPFPPHTRGCTRNWADVERRGWVSPAHAGMYRPPRGGLRKS